MRLASEPRLPQSTSPAEDRAVQDPPRLRQGTPYRQGGGRHPHRGPAGVAGPTGTWRGHLLNTVIRQARPGEGRALTAAYGWLFGPAASRRLVPMLRWTL